MNPNQSKLFQEKEWIVTRVVFSFGIQNGIIARQRHVTGHVFIADVGGIPCLRHTRGRNKPTGHESTSRQGLVIRDRSSKQGHPKSQIHKHLSSTALCSFVLLQLPTSIYSLSYKQLNWTPTFQRHFKDAIRYHYVRVNIY